MSRATQSERITAARSLFVGVAAFALTAGMIVASGAQGSAFG